MATIPVSRRTKLLTENGKAFIRNVGTYFTNNAPFGNQSLIKGNNGTMPRSDAPADKIWSANIFIVNDQGETTTQQITNNTELVEYLIILFDRYAIEFDVDANVIASQSFTESEYRIWVYNNARSTASSLSQFLMSTMYDLLYQKQWLTDAERDLLVVDMTNPVRASSWVGVKTDETTGEDNIATQNANHSIFHQNLINNPHLSIKLQCRFMSWIAERNANLVSSSLFAYSRGSSRQSANYIELINTVDKNNGRPYTDEGLRYVEEIFAYLGDKDQNKVNSNRIKKYVRGFSFGFDKTLALGEDFNSFDANAKSGLPNRTTRSVTALKSELRLAYENAKEIFEEKYIGQYSVGLSSVYRTPEDQFEYYQRGRNGRGEVVDKSAIITYVDGFNRKSRHNYVQSRAFDFFIYNEQTKKIDWDNITLFEEFARLVQVGSDKIEWGGDWESFRDYPHVQI